MPEHGETEDLLLRDFAPRSMLVTANHEPERARLPVVDAHNHLGLRRASPDGQEAWRVPDVEALLETMDEVGVRAIVNLDGGWGETLRRNLERYREPHPDRFVVFAGVDWSRVAESSFGERLAEELEASARAGASGLKIFKVLGLTVRLPTGELLRLDDPRLRPLWAKAGELRVPVLYHVADPRAFFEPLDRFNERWEELRRHPDWRFHGPSFPSYSDLMEQQDRMLEANPDTTFISAHVASSAEDLGLAAALLDRHPNLYVDFGARIAELGRQPFSARRFFLRYQDRILFGTDATPTRHAYRVYFRFLESEDEYFSASAAPEREWGQGRWRIYGLSLPSDVLDKVYQRNAERLIPGLLRK